MARRRTASWNRDLESPASPAKPLSNDRRNNKTPVSTTDRTKKTFKRLCSYKCAVGALGVLAVYVFLAASWDVSHTADPCQVALSTKHELQKSQRKDSTLPKIIHHQWKTSDIPEKFKEWHDKWYELFPKPEYTHMLWTDANAREMIQQYYSWFLNTYDGYEYGISRADAARYFYLHRYGGLHVDLDYEPLTNFFEYLPTDQVGLVESPYKFNEETQNSLMSSPKGDPFWQGVFDAMVENASKGVLKATGPSLLDKASKQSSLPFFILPCELFHRIPLGENDKSPFLTNIHREIFGRLYPMKQCGDFNDVKCQFAKHHNTAVYLKETGLLNLIWK